MTVVAKAHAVMVVSNNVPEGHFMTVPALPFVHRKYPLQSFVAAKPVNPGEQPPPPPLLS